MRRKLIVQGGGGYTIYLPKGWVEGQGLGAGDEVSIDEQEGTLEIAAPGRKKERKVELSFSAEDWHAERPEKYVQRILAVAYKQGAEEIVVRCKDRRIMDYIERRIDGFIGIEIIDQTADSLTVRSLAEGSDLDLQSVIQRCLHITRHIAKETATVLAKPDDGAIANLLRMERTHNKLTDFAKRLLTRRHVTDEKYLYALILEDERLVDEYKALLQKCGKKPPRAIILLVGDIANYLEVLLSLIATMDPERIKQLSAQYVPLRERAKRLLGKDGAAMHLHSIIVRSYELGETVLEWKMPTRPLG